MNSDETADIVKIINQGVEKNKPVMRVNKDDHNKIEFFDVFCPKIISTRREFQDKATESRCMTNVMRQTSRKDIPPNLTAEFWKEAQSIRNKLLLWRFRNYKKINPDAGANIDLGDIEPRLRQINIGFVALFEHDTEALEDFKQFLKSYSQELIEARTETVEGRIVKAICEILTTEGNLTAQNIIEKSELKDQYGILWQPRKISSKMKELGFSSSILERKGSDVLKVYPYKADALLNLAKKYLSDSDLLSSVKKLCNEVTDVTVVTDRAGLGLNSYFDGNVNNVGVSYTKVTTVTTLQNKQDSLPSFDDIQSMLLDRKEMSIDELKAKGYAQVTLDKWKAEGTLIESRVGFLRLNL